MCSIRCDVPPVVVIVLAVGLAGAPVGRVAHAQSASAPDSAMHGAVSDSTAPAPAPDSLQVPAVRDTATRVTATSKRALGMADTVTALPAVRVDADRREDPTRAAATTVRLERARVVRFQPSTVADALVATPGVELVRTGPWASNVSLRGLGGERVLVLVDGLRLQTGRGHGAQMSLIPVDRIESVEVQPGAGGVQYGSDALGGVVQLSTHRPLLGARGTSAAFTARSGAPGNARSGYGAVRYRSPRLGAELSGAFGGLDALVTPDGAQPNSSYHEDDYAARFEARLAGSTLQLDHARHAARDIMLPAFTTDAGTFASYPLQSRSATRFEWLTPRADARPELRVIAADQRYHTGFVESVVDSQFVRGRFVAEKTTRADDRIGMRGLSLYPTLSWGRTRVFGELRRETTDGPRYTDERVVNSSGVQTSASRSEGESVPDASRLVWGGGVYSGFESHGVRLEGGARFDRVHAQADSNAGSFTSQLDAVEQRTSGELGLARVTGSVQPFARIATGFRAPNLEERYFNDEVHAGMRLFGNPGLRAERSTTVELGLRTGEWFGGRVSRARVSAYRSRVSDLISLAYLGQLYRVPRFQYTNVRNTVLDGVEAELALALGGYRVECMASAPRGRDLATGKPLADLGAAHVASDLRIPVPRLLPNGSLTLRARWTDVTSPDDPTLVRPAHWSSDAELACVQWQTRFALVVRNLAGARYREALSFIDEPGRTFLFAVRHELALAR